MSADFETDVVIVGAGPVGLFAVFECGMLGFRTVVVDCLDQIGGQCTALYPEKPIYDIPAYPSILAGDLIAQLEAQAQNFKPHYLLSHQLIEFSGQENNFLLTAQNQIHKDQTTKIACKAIVIASGAGSFGPQKPPLADLSLYEGRSIFYSVRQKSQFQDRVVAIAGGGDSAVDWAVSLSSVASHVHLIHRREKFRAAPASLEQMRAIQDKGKITLHTPYQLQELHGTGGVLTGLTVMDLEGQTKTIETDFLLPFFGLSMELGPLADWGLNLHRHTIEISQATAETSIKGIYAIGDMAHYPHKLKLILTGFAEAAQAAHSIRQQIYPEQDYHFEYSTTKGIPTA
jgi:thioredoxin reductase (NADPH)